ncbi:MAG: SLBB domain-containing protein [Vicinamibacterales bacterium]
MELKEFQRPRFFVTGEVDKPGAFPLHGKMGVLEAIAMAGGFKRSAKHSQVTLFRRVDDTHMMGTILDAKAIAKSVDSRNVEIQPGDVLVVPENKLSKVTSIVPFAGALGSIGWFLSIVND